MKKCKKLVALTMAVLLAFACYAVPAFASSSANQYGLEATIVTDKESYKANEDIHVTVTVKNTNAFKVENVSMESLLPEALTLKDGSNSTKTVDLEPGETLTLSFTAVKEKEETSATEPESQSTEPTETKPVIPSESETVKPSESESVRPSETATVQPSESETVKPSETETQQPTQAPTTEQPTQGTTTPIITETTTSATTTEGTTPAPNTTGTQTTTGGIIGDLTTTFPKITTPANSATTAQAENPDTGDSMSVKTLAIAIIALFALIAIVIILMYKYKKQTTKIISLVMCVAVAATAITGVTFFTAEGVDDNRKSFTVEKVIMVDGEETTLQADIKYDNGKQDLANGYVNEELYSSETDDNHIIVLKDGRKFVDNEILLTAKDGVEKSEIESLVKEYQGRIVGYIKIMNDYQIRFDKTYSYDELEGLIEEFQKNPLIEEAMLQGVLDWDTRSISPATNDIKWIGDWDAIPTGANWGIEAIEARQAWKYSKYMNDVHVGILDVGFDTNHEDLTFGEIPLFNEEKNHGTHVAGIIGATYNNEKGITGISPNKVNLFGAVPRTWSMYEACLVYVIYGAKSKVVNISLSGELIEFAAYMGNQNAINEINKYADLITRKLKKLINMGCEFVICTAAGNQGKFNPLESGYTYSKDSSAYYGYKKDKNGWLCGIKGSNELLSVINDPIVKDRVITVGALENKGDREYTIAPYSQIGSNVDIMAPGSKIQSTICNNAYDYMDGTSMASPHVAGVASMVFSINPELTGKQVKEILLSTGTGNYDNLKMVNAINAVERAIDSLNTVLHGQVIDKLTSIPIKNVQVEALDKEGHFVRQAYTNENGEFSLKLPSDTFSIRFSLLGYQTVFKEITLVKGITTVFKSPVVLQEIESPIAPDPTPGIDDNFAGGDGSKENPYQIATTKQLDAVRNHLNSHFILLNDINFAGYVDENGEQKYFTPIGKEEKASFTGTFDGKGHTIKNVKIRGSNVGLFVSLENSIVQNLNLQSISIMGDYNVGTIAATSKNSIIRNCNVLGTIEYWGFMSTGMRVGGICGTNEEGKIEQCYYMGNIESTIIYTTGGITGWNSGEIINCGYKGGYCYGGYATGGIVGYNYGKIINCFNRAFVGSNYRTRYSGGGINYNLQAFGGGIAARNSGVIEGCFNTGSVYGWSLDDYYIGKIGGIVADNEGSISYCYNTGTILQNHGRPDREDCDDVESIVAGIASRNKGEISNCYNIGILDSDTVAYYFGAVPGEVGVKNVYFGDFLYTNYERYGYKEGGERRSEVEMKSDRFVGLLNEGPYLFIKDTEGVNNGYPILKWQKP